MRGVGQPPRIMRTGPWRKVSGPECPGAVPCSRSAEDGWRRRCRLWRSLACERIRAAFLGRSPLRQPARRPMKRFIATCKPSRPGVINRPAIRSPTFTRLRQHHHENNHHPAARCDAHGQEQGADGAAAHRAGRGGVESGPDVHTERQRDRVDAAGPARRGAAGARDDQGTAGRGAEGAGPACTVFRGSAGAQSVQGRGSGQAVFHAAGVLARSGDAGRVPGAGSCAGSGAGGGRHGLCALPHQVQRREGQQQFHRES